MRRRILLLALCILPLAAIVLPAVVAAKPGAPARSPGDTFQFEGVVARHGHTLLTWQRFAQRDEVWLELQDDPGTVYVYLVGDHDEAVRMGLLRRDPEHGHQFAKLEGVRVSGTARARQSGIADILTLTQPAASDAGRRP